MARAGDEDVDHEVFTRLRSNSDITAPLFRTFTGGAVLLAGAGASEQTQQPGETTPLRQQSDSQRRRQQTQEQLQARLMEEVAQFVQRSLAWIIIFALAFTCAIIVIIVFSIQGLIAVLTYMDLPCDRPLKFYLLVVALWSQVPSRVKAWLTDIFELHSPFHLMAITVLLALPSWIIIGWGVWMITSSKTCAKTNPHLFYPTERFIIAQAVFTLLCLVFVLISAYGLRHIVLLAARLSAKPGCEKAVRQLPKVAPDSPELLDEDEKTVMDCPICSDSLANQQDSAVVRTPCAHHYHEECLATWCKNHMDCPLCRQVIGDEDEPCEAV